VFVCGASSSPARFAPAVSFTVDTVDPAFIVKSLDKMGICVWDGNFYAPRSVFRLASEPELRFRRGKVDAKCEATSSASLLINTEPILEPERRSMQATVQRRAAHLFAGTPHSVFNPSHNSSGTRPRFSLSVVDNASAMRWSTSSGRATPQ
jgi:hypothetical protein